MNWKRARFKGQKVWAQVDAEGALLVDGGRTPIRYSDKPGAKVYSAGASRVSVDGDAAAVDLDDGAPREEMVSGQSSRRVRVGSGATPKGIAVAYTDGACSGNPGPAGSGALLSLPNGRVAEATLSLGHGTNNIAELTALDLVLDLLEEEGLPKDTRVRLITDSSYAIGVLAKGWKAKKNTELILGMRKRFAAWTGVELTWVKGHAGNEGNERADELARLGATGETWTRWVG